MSLLQKAKGFGRNLLDFAVAYGDRQYTPEGNAGLEEMAGPEGSALARTNYDRNFRAARWQAIRQGAGPAEMDNLGHLGASKPYNEDMMRAVAVAEALKQQRQKSGRTKAISDYIRTNTDLTDGQRSLLGAVDEETAGQTLIKQQFPTLSGDGSASAGTVTSTFKGQNGTIWNIVQTGDPTNPVKAYDTGVRDDRRPSEIRTLQSYEDDPSKLDTRKQRAFAEKYGTQAAEFQATTEQTLPQIMQDSQNAIMRLTKLKQKIAVMPTGRLVGTALTQVSAEMQAIHAELTQNALIKIGQLKQQGVSLTPITEKELKVLFDTSAKVSNLPEANIKIIDLQLEQLQQVIDQAEQRLSWIDEGKPILNFRMRSGSASPAAKPAAPPAAETAAQRAARMRGGR